MTDQKMIVLVCTKIISVSCCKIFMLLTQRKYQLKSIKIIRNILKMDSYLTIFA